MSSRRHHRSNSTLSTSLAFPLLIQPELDSMESSLQAIFEEITKTDRRYLGSLIGGSIFAVVGFMIFTSATIVAGILGGAIGFGVGHLIGRRWKRNKVIKSALTKDMQYQLRLCCLLIYLSTLKKTKIPISEYSGILEKVIDEFRPAFVLQLHNPAFMKEVQKLRKFLKTSVAHTALLNSAYEIAHSIEFGINIHFTSSRIRRILIPVLQLLKDPIAKEGHELEIVRRIEEILANDKTKVILKKSHLQDEDIIGMILPFPGLSCKLIGKNVQTCKAISDIEHFLEYKTSKAKENKSCENKKYFEKLMFRRSSLPGYSTRDPHYKMNYKDLLSLEIISKLSAANETFNPPLFQQDETGDDFEIDSVSEDVKCHIKIEFDEKENSPAKSHFNSPEKTPSSSMIPVPVHLPFEGSAIDMDEDSDHDEEKGEIEMIQKEEKVEKIESPCISHRSSSRLSDKEERKESADVNEKETFKIDMRVHKFQDCFDKLLEIEKEPVGDKVWRHCVNKPGTQVYQRKAENSPVCMIKGFCDIEYSTETVVKAIWDTAVRTQWDHLFHEFRIVAARDDAELLYYMIKTPFGVTRRDWLQRRIMIRDYPEPGMIVLHFVSVDDPAMPPRKGVIRAETAISGYILRPKTARTCTVTIISQNDVKGLVPKSIVNSMASRAPLDWVKNMKRGCQMVAGY